MLHWKVTFIEQDLRKQILRHNLVPFLLIFNYYQSWIIQLFSSHQSLKEHTNSGTKVIFGPMKWLLRKVL